jgi:hypothetical protein
VRFAEAIPIGRLKETSLWPLNIAMASQPTETEREIGTIEGLLITLFAVGLGTTDVLLALSFASNHHEELFVLLALLFMAPIGAIAATTGMVTAAPRAMPQVPAQSSTEVPRLRRVGTVPATR